MTELVQRFTGNCAVWIVQTSSMSIKQKHCLKIKRENPFGIGGSGKPQP